jgi:hypothetical protein
MGFDGSDLISSPACPSGNHARTSSFLTGNHMLLVIESSLHARAVKSNHFLLALAVCSSRDCFARLCCMDGPDVLLEIGEVLR